MVAQVKRKKRRHAKAPQMIKKANEPQPLQASQKDEQMLEGNQLNGVYGLPQGWASPSTHEG